jgi:hypothetical protein
METRLHFRGTRTEMRAAIKKLPEYLSGDAPDVLGIARVYKAYFAYHWFVKVRDGYLIKSNGGTDDTGMRWKPNAASTIAKRALRPGDIRRIRGKTESPLNERVRGLLTPLQDALWRGVFKSNYLRLLSREPQHVAKARAAQIAWGIVKKGGAQTKIGLLGSRKLPIGQNTGRLLAACSPGKISDGGYSPTVDQVIVYGPNNVELKIQVPYAGDFHKDRPIWPVGYKSFQANADPWLKYAAKKALEDTVRYIGRMGKIK